MRKILFTSVAFEEYSEWNTENKKVFSKLNSLIKEASKTPFEGLGKPEPLKHEYQGCWSRKITDEHRLIYRIENELIEIISCKFHYK